MRDVEERISFKEKRIERHAEYKHCDEVKEEVISLKKRLRELSKEKRCLMEANRKSKWYYNKKKPAQKERQTLSNSTSPEPANSQQPLFDSPYQSSYDDDYFGDDFIPPSQQ